MKQLDPKAVWLFFIGSIGRTIFLAVVVLMWGVAPILSLWGQSGHVTSVVLAAVLVVVVVLILSFLWAKLTYHFYRYELSPNGFKKESGVIYKRYVTIPYERIQNVDIHRGIVARMLGLSDLLIQTAGASASISRYGSTGIASEGRLMGITHADAEVMRDELVKRAQGQRNQAV